MNNKVPGSARLLLTSIPTDFVDDGCSASPDSICGDSIRWACRIHDWRYCTRAHRPGRMTTEYRKNADKELRTHMRLDLPWYSQWTRLIYHFFVRKFGNGDNSFDSCGPEVGEKCRHNMPQPVWMRAEVANEMWNTTLEDV